MSGDISGILDTRPALERLTAGLPNGNAPLPVAVELNLGGERMVMPYDAESIAIVLESCYRVGGFSGLEIIYDAAVTVYAAFCRGSDNEEVSLTGALAEKEKSVGDARSLIGDIGDQSANEEALAQKLAARDLYSTSTRTALDRLNRERARRAEQMQALREQIDVLAEIEEEAQRWYEQKLFAAIELDFAKRQRDLEALWLRYKIGDTKTGLPVWFKDVDSADGLAILATDDQATVKGGEPGPPIPGTNTPRFQGSETDIPVHAVIKATHELALAQYKYRMALTQSHKVKASTARPVDPAKLSAYPERKAYCDLLNGLAEKYFIVHAAHRGLNQTEEDRIFDKKKVEAAVIEAFLRARDAMPEILADMRENLLFRDDEPAAVIGKQAMARPAAEVLIAARYDERVMMVKADEPGSGTVMGTGGKPVASDRPTPKIFRSPWLQEPFHLRLRQLADTFREDTADDAPAGNAAGRPGPDGKTTPEDREKSAEAALENKRLASEVAHLRPLFTDEGDRQMLLWITSLGTIMERARLEVVTRLSERVAREAEMRRTAQQAIAVAGLLTAPFTAGKSLIVAGAIDAILVADQATTDVEHWIAARQFSKIVLDGVAAAHWAEPEVAQLVGQLLEAGYEIASDLVQTGTIGKIFDAIGAAQLLLAIPDVTALLLKDSTP